MTERTWNPQHEEDENGAEEIAASIVDKALTPHEERVQAGISSNNDISHDQQSHPTPSERTLAQLHKEARQRGVKGRYQMSKTQLEQSLKH